MSPKLHKIILFLLLILLGTPKIAITDDILSLDYNKMIILDAEMLAELGIKTAYDRIKKELKKYVHSPLKISEEIDSKNGKYYVICAGKKYEIQTGSESQEDAWSRATFTLFDIINRQLKNLDVKFYALNGGNDLGGIFLSEKQFQVAKKQLPKKTDWPYLPTLDPPLYGQYQ